MTYTDLTTATHPERSVLTVDGSGPPETPAFGAAIEALHTTRAWLGGGDVPIEGTYWQRDGSDFDLGRPEEWEWTLAVPAPEGVASLDATGADGVRLVRQPAVDVIEAEHHGPYADEGPTLDALRTEAAAQGRTIAGPHTERYLTDPRSTAPDQLRTLLWYPLEP